MWRFKRRARRAGRVRRIGAGVPCGGVDLLDVAEAVKLQYGSALPDEVGKKEEIQLSTEEYYLFLKKTKYNTIISSP